MEIISNQDRETLERLEVALWREESRFDLQQMNELIADDFIEVGRSGRVYQRQDTLAMSRQPIEAILPLPNFHVRLLGENIAQVTYDSAVTHEGIVEYARRSSIWSRSIAGWVLRFHQGTPFQP